MKITVKQFGKEVETLTSWSKDSPIMTDCYNKNIELNSWAEAMNYINTDGNRTMGNGDYYYDTVDEAVQKWIESGAVETEEEAREFFAKPANHYLIGELSQGELILEETYDDELAQLIADNKIYFGDGDPEIIADDFRECFYNGKDLKYKNTPPAWLDAQVEALLEE